MRQLNLLCKLCLIPLFFVFLFSGSRVTAQEKTETVKKYVTLRYFNENNSLQYLLLTAVAKTDMGVMPQKGVDFSLYLDEQSAASLIGTAKTDMEGSAKYFIPPSLKSSWDSAAHHLFIAVANEGTDEEQSQETEITKAQISIDTLNEEGVRSITAEVKKLENGEWVAVPDVEMKIGVKRLGGVLSGGDEPSYTTDENGMVQVEFTKENLPGDENGNLILRARVEDNDEVGNLIIEKQVPWGVQKNITKNFFEQRTLWSTRFHTPYWLLIIAYSIVLSVWGTLIYLVFQLIKIKKLGKTV